MAQNVREGPSQPAGSRRCQPGEESNGIRQESISQSHDSPSSGTECFQVARNNVVTTAMAGHSQPSRNEDYTTQDESSIPAVMTLPGTYANPQGGILLIAFITKLTPIISLDSVFCDA
jgi:hypothetical protein